MEGILNRIITGDESWVYEYDPCAKRLSMTWLTKDEPHSKKAHMSKSKIKSMLIIFFNSQGVIMKEWLPQSRTVNTEYYLTIMKKTQRQNSKEKTRPLA